MDQLIHARCMIDLGITSVIESEDLSKKVQLKDLMTELMAVDDYYKSCCDEADHGWGQDVGTSYEEGMSMEFYIESDDWHRISLILRKIKGDMNWQ